MYSNKNACLDIKCPGGSVDLAFRYFFAFFALAGGSGVQIPAEEAIFTAACCRHFECPQKCICTCFVTWARWNLAQFGPNGEKLKKRDIFNTLVWTKFENLIFFKHLSSKFEKYFQTNMYLYQVIEKWLPKSASFFSSSK